MNAQKLRDISTPYRVVAVVGLMLAVVLSAVTFSTARAQNHGTDIVFTAGVNDNFIGPFEPTSPSSNFLVWLNSIGVNHKNFDDPQYDRAVAHTFAGLPSDIQVATLEVHLRAGASPLSYNDSINLFFVGDNQILPPEGPERWGRYIGTNGANPVPGVLSYDWVSTTGSQTVDTILLDLGNLPLAPGQPVNASNIIPALNQHGFLDFYIQDDTDVDYIILTVTSTGKQVICHIPPGNPSNAQTITVSVAAVNAHLNHGDTLGACPLGEKFPRGR